eukprot:CAMPEP_0170601646 /NCGR_PEP_ID=MMETSP0224-20130122/17971_1 /TAXON_ID=285029 /ORGANISM="Togula jolla, Strain CCCM 725" /LENGTH=84 /DNA_ID=CAMNT_0010926437 /DNA_START=426 /DNA_END=676 /DNA_ORIENTATION=-
MLQVREVIDRYCRIPLPGSLSRLETEHGNAPDLSLPLPAAENRYGGIVAWEECFLHHIDGFKKSPSGSTTSANKAHHSPTDPCG